MSSFLFRGENILYYERRFVMKALMAKLSIKSILKWGATLLGIAASIVGVFADKKAMQEEISKSVSKEVSKQLAKNN